MGSVIELFQFAQILCWIILPLLIITASVTTYLHYRKKKKNLVESSLIETGNPDTFSQLVGAGDYIFFDHSKLISDYKRKITSNQARYTALQQDFSRLMSKYSALAIFTNQKLDHHKNSSMENYRDQLPQYIQEEINLLVQDHAAEKKEMNSRLEQMGRSYKSLEEENESLLQQLQAEHGNEGERDTIISKWKDENSQLKEKIAEQDYLKDILEEKKAQIVFLQNQLEQRIVQNHQSDIQRNQLATQIEDLKQIREGELGAMQLRISSLTEELDQCQTELADKKDRLQSTELSLAQSEELWKTARTNCEMLEERLLANRQTLRRLYSEFASCMETEEVPVIQLRPEYSSAEEG